MKGRSVASILRQMEEWHKELGQDTKHPSLSWRHSSLKDFRLVEGNETLGNMRVWTITELLTSRALFLEGKAMRHCVATYANLCARCQTSIWSMQVENQQGRHRNLTIEVDLTTRTICQARRKRNRLPQAAEREVMEHWTAEQGLLLLPGANRQFRGTGRELKSTVAVVLRRTLTSRVRSTVWPPCIQRAFTS